MRKKFLSTLLSPNKVPPVVRIKKGNPANCFCGNSMNKNRFFDYIGAVVPKKKRDRNCHKSSETMTEANPKGKG